MTCVYCHLPIPEGDTHVSTLNCKLEREYSHVYCANEELAYQHELEGGDDAEE